VQNVQVTAQLDQAAEHPRAHSHSGKVIELAQRLVESQADADAKDAHAHTVIARLESDLHTARSEATHARVAAEQAGAQYAQLLQQLRESERHGTQLADDLEAVAARRAGEHGPPSADTTRRAETAEAVATAMQEDAARADAAHAELQVTAGALQATLENVQQQLQDLRSERDTWQRKCGELAQFATGASVPGCFVLLFATMPSSPGRDIIVGPAKQ
jgi:chromosome segregation ATPase